jgi:hypothetical protein
LLYFVRDKKVVRVFVRFVRRFSVEIKTVASRIISGNVLSGKQVQPDGYLDYYVCNYGDLKVFEFFLDGITCIR